MKDIDGWRRIEKDRKGSISINKDREGCRGTEKVSCLDFLLSTLKLLCAWSCRMSIGRLRSSEVACDSVGRPAFSPLVLNVRRNETEA